MDNEKDYKAIAEALADRLYFALNHWKYSGGLVMDKSRPGKAITPMHFFAEGLEMMGYKFAKEDINALALPAAAKRKYFAAKAKAKSQPPEPTATTGNGSEGRG